MSDLKNNSEQKNLETHICPHNIKWINDDIEHEISCTCRNLKNNKEKKLCKFGIECPNKIKCLYKHLNDNEIKQLYRFITENKIVPNTNKFIPTSLYKKTFKNDPSKDKEFKKVLYDVKSEEASEEDLNISDSILIDENDKILVKNGDELKKKLFFEKINKILDIVWNDKNIILKFIFQLSELNEISDRKELKDLIKDIQKFYQENLSI